MPTSSNLLRVSAVLILLGSPLLGGAQTSEAPLDTYVSQSVGEAESLVAATIGKWAVQHPGETVETPADRNRDYHPENARSRQERNLEGRWCLRSTAEIDLAGGVRARRIALFYQPLVEGTYGKSLPPLPTEKGDELRKHGCRLVRILHEFEGVSDPQNFVEAIAKQLPGKRLEEPGTYTEFSRNEYWKPVYSFEKFGQPRSYHSLFAHNPKEARPEDKPAILLEWAWGTLEYGNPSSKTINPEAGQPWLALRAAMLARLPEAPTLAMLSFLAPRVGDYWEQPPLYCHRQLVPVLREWLKLAASSAPEKHAAALLLADRVLDRLGDCEEFCNSGSCGSPEEEDFEANHDALEKDLQELGIGTTASAHLGYEHYSGNLLDKVRQLAPTGAVNELYRMAILDERCQWDSNSDSADCADIIVEGEDFLSLFPEDEWTPSVHLILAEANALTLEDLLSSNSATPANPWETRATAHYRAWYAKSRDERDRALVWQEIWAIEAGMGPWLLMPPQLQQ